MLKVCAACGIKARKVRIFVGSMFQGQNGSRALSMDPAAEKEDSPKGPYLLGQNRGIIPFDGEGERAEYLAALEGYLRYRLIWKEHPEAYYAFLRGMLKSPVPRIKEDARCEILHLARSCPKFDLCQVLDDGAVDDGIKDYLRLIWVPGNPHRYPPALHKEGGI